MRMERMADVSVSLEKPDIICVSVKPPSVVTCNVTKGEHLKDEKDRTTH